MFSYKLIIQKLIDVSIYNRGARLYLDGGVVQKKDLDLNYWRQYNIHDNYNKKNYKIITPVLHKSVDINNWDKLEPIITNFVKCNCEYFEEENGICKHIACVFLDLENEFCFKKRSNVGQLTENLYDQIKSVEKHKTTQELNISFDNLLVNHQWNGRFRFFSQLNSEINTNNIDKVEISNLKKVFTKKIHQHLKIWENEKEIHQLIIDSLLNDTNFWIEIWLEVLDYIHFDNYKKLIHKLFKIKEQISKNYSIILKHLLNRFSGEQIKQVFDFVIESNKFDFKTTLELAFDLKIDEYILQNSHLIDPENLLSFAKDNPDQFEAIEILIIEQLKQWLIFIKSEDYSTIDLIFEKWVAIENGVTHNLHMFFDYISVEYKKRRNLIAIINKYK